MTHADFEEIAALDAIGAATSEEASSLRAHLAACIPCRRARDEYAQAATLLATDLTPVAPPPHVRARIAAQVTPRRTRAPWWLAAAAIGALAFLLVSQQRTHRSEVTRLMRQNAELTARADKLSAEIRALASAETRTISLAGQEAAPRASARVFLEPNRRRAVVFFYNLPPNAKDKCYQLWIIRADQPKPVSAGIFDVTSGNASIAIENLPLSTEIKALAVTLEPHGGVEQPTSTRFYVAGDA
ncbi:MAG TPA: anti-sigma factor [Thermoanaerobaculia bacterium]|jgi:cell division protein FtsB